MALSAIFIFELALVYFVGAVTGPRLARLVRRGLRRLRRRREWDGYFQN